MTTRPTVDRVWASSAPSSSITDPDTQSPNKVKGGWEAEVPPFQWFNWVQNRNDLFKLALVERGIAQWGSEISYARGALTFLDDDGKIYQAVKANKNVKPDPTDTSTWAKSAVSITQADLDRIENYLNTHINNKSNPHQVTAAQAGAYDKAQIRKKVKAVQDGIDAHEALTNNPHKVTAAQAGAVPIAGGTYTGQVDFDTGKIGVGSGSVDATSGIKLEKGSDSIGIDSTGKPVFNTEKLLFQSEYEALKLKEEPKYAVPRPDFWMPLSCDTNIYEGRGVTEFTRSSKATYVNKQGVLKIAETDEPRFEKEGILIEGSSTNLANNSEGLWYSPYSRYTVTQITGNTPYGGGKKYSQYVSDTSNSDGRISYFGSTGALTRGNTYTASIWVHRDNPVTDYVVRVDAYAPVPMVEIARAGDWIRLAGSILFPATGADPAPRISCNVTAGDINRYFGMQVEELPFASSYIPTSGSPATRAADTLEIPGYDAVGDNCTIHIEVDPVGLVSSADRVWYNGAHFRGGVYGYGYDANNSLSTLDVAGTLSTGSYTTTIRGSTQVNIYKDGVTKAAGDCDAARVIGSTFLGSDNSGGLPLYGHLKGFRVWNQVLTPEQISTL